MDGYCWRTITSGNRLSMEWNVIQFGDPIDNIFILRSENTEIGRGFKQNQLIEENDFFSTQESV